MHWSNVHAAVIVVGLAALPVAADWQLQTPPADVDKQRIWDTSWDWDRTDHSCWMAVAANQLAAVGYGFGATLQDRADDIYRDMIVWQDVAANGVFDGAFKPDGRYSGDGLEASGWSTTAANWWLGSVHNVWKATQTHYTWGIGVDHGTTAPWNEPDVPEQIGNLLRAGVPVGLDIARIDPDTPEGEGRAFHVVTAQGDSGNASPLTSNPSHVKVTDSDEDTNPATGLLWRYPGDPIQDHAWFELNNPPFTYEGPGWYFQRKNELVFVARIVPMFGTANVGNEGTAEVTVGSYQIRNLHPTNSADSLHYEVASTNKMLNWSTTLSHETTFSPSISFDADGTMHADWQFSTPVPPAQFVTITTQIITDQSAALTYNNVAFNVGATAVPGLPNFSVLIADTQLAPNHSMEVGGETESFFYEPFACGGFIIGAFDILKQRTGEKIGEYRFIHEYAYDEDPEQHLFTLQSLVAEGADTHDLSQLRFGHSYVFLDEQGLWGFDDWMEVSRGLVPLTPTTTITHAINWEGRLPYPEIEYFTNDAIPEPNTLALLALGGLVVRHRRRKPPASRR
jgi:hypothetical protein